MTANFTRRLDLFRDAGFPHPEAVVAALTAEARALPALSPDGHVTSELRAALASRAGRLESAQLRLARLVPEWLMERNGDLATALWLARSEHGDALDLAGFLLAAFAALLEDPRRERDALAFARFLFDLSYGWERVYVDPALAYEFLREREPNPLVWRVLAALAEQSPRQRLRVLELGCGVGNDAFGWLESEKVEGYAGIDLSPEALETFERRVAERDARPRPVLLRGEFLDVLERDPPELAGVSLVYSYSSLHYFNSTELARLLELVRARLAPRGGHHRGWFAFGIKGAGSIWEGQGVPVYRPDVWVNWDGQSRWFPARDALRRLLDRAGFELFIHELVEHWGYSERGKRDVFHHVLCSPRG
jgi:SAM-dependent methyltransferase